MIIILFFFTQVRGKIGDFIIGVFAVFQGTYYLGMKLLFAFYPKYDKLCSKGSSLSHN